jgi:hypothetical protein
MQPVNAAGLAIVFRNPDPQRQFHYPNGWMLLASERRLKIFVYRDDTRSPRVVRKEAA